MLRLLLLLSIVLSADAWAAKSYLLFSAPGVQSATYDADVAALQAGDEVVFSNGSRFEVKAVLGKGNTARILDVGGGKALRIPLKSGRFDKTMSYMDYVDAFLEGYKTLKEREAPVVETYVDESLPREYVVVEALSVKFTYDDFITGKVKLSEEQATKVQDDFIEFARKTWGFSIVGDQHTEQVVYTADKGWLFLDFDARNKTASSFRHGTIFTKGMDELMAERYAVHAHEMMMVIDKLPTPKKIHVRIMVAIEEERLRRGFKPPFSCIKWLKEKWVGLTGN
ncbi:MAG: hypothetical protein HY075_15460 [Deltaproteobacteria bacterium]|nr:hypothetical protein [Deltaproteobacteria bacterium]